MSYALMSDKLSRPAGLYKDRRRVLGPLMPMDEPIKWWQIWKW